MELVNQFVEQIKNFGYVEWILVVTCFIELATIMLFNRGALKAQERIKQYELELKAVEGEKNALLDTIENFDERGAM